MDRRQFEIITIIASRKTEFCLNAEKKLVGTLPPNLDQKEAVRRLRRVISELDNLLFLSDAEKTSVTVTPGVPVAGLKLDQQEIMSRIGEAMILEAGARP